MRIMTITVALEYDGSDILTVPHEALRTEGDLLAIAQEIAFAREVRLSDVSIRFVDAFDELLRHFPTEEMVDEDDPAYPEVAADSGCRTCANGDPCQVRIEADIADILAEARLTDAEKLLCLAWMIEEGCSSLTQSIHQMAEAFTSYLAKAALEPTAPPVNLAGSAKVLSAGMTQA